MARTTDETALPSAGGAVSRSVSTATREVCRGGSAIWLMLLTASVACGARTPLNVSGARVPDAALVDGGGIDAPMRPDAGTDAGPALPTCRMRPERPGTIRWSTRSEELQGQGGFTEAGDAVLPVAGREPGAIELAAFDRCTGAHLWQTPMVPGASGQAHPVVRRLAGGELLVTNSLGAIVRYGVWSFEPDGTVRPAPLAMERLFGLYGIAGGGCGGAVVRVATDPARLERYDSDFNLVSTFDDPPRDEECALAVDQVVCFDGVYDLESGAPVWATDRTEILDGTFRHVVGPAVGRETLYAAIYGISTYDLVARDLTTGRQTFRVPLMRTNRGQTDLLIGAPVLGPDGTIYVYVNGHREGVAHTGELVAFAPDGSERWRHVQNATRQEFFQHATHLVGNVGVVYLAVGTTVTALDAVSGEMRWQSAGGVQNTPGLSMNRAGELLLRTDAGVGQLIVTESTGLAASPWPSRWGDHLQRNAR